MGYRDDALIELFRVETWYEGYVDDDGGQEQGYEVQDEAHGGLYDVVITTRTVKNEWPTDRHVDRTAAERLTWNGTAYDRVPIYDGEDEDEGATVDDDDADDGTDGDTDDGDTDDGTDGTDGTDGDAGDADQPWD